ncbi:hypothetical protein Peur_015754 [Populus x canadensis]
MARNHGVKNPLNFIIITDGELLELGPSQDDTDFVPAAIGFVKVDAAALSCGIGHYGNLSMVLSVCCISVNGVFLSMFRAFFDGKAWVYLISYGLPYPEASVHHLPRHNSDRSRILSTLSRSIPAREIWPFDILAAWMQHADFKQIINDAWRANDSSIVDAIDSITDATKDLLEKISSNIDVYFKRKRCLHDRINGIQKYLIIK